LKEELA
jgi:hypothetical protein